MFGFFVRIFESDPRWWRRALAPAGCGLIIAVGATWQLRAKIVWGEAIAILFMLPGFFLAAGCLLATMDNVQQRIRSGQAVSRLSRMLFGMHEVSVVIWFILLLIVGFPLAFWIGNLTWRQHAG
jgi:hypothetical protein